MATTIALAKRNSDLWNCCLSVSIEQLCTVEDDSVVLLTCSRKETRNINKADDRNVECVTEAYEACTLAACVNVEHTSINRRLVGYDTNALTVETGKTYDDVACELWLNLEELSVVNNATYHLIHIVCLVAVVWDNLIERILKTVNRVVADLAWSCLHIV